ncbi:membrane protein insertase YidC [Capnocytophaga canimorsus]|uniref:Membrane protein insertase YidC n=1 Tax=Capnocytophaga canimorsus (strain 5) TaxID=860228 RepID=F9YUS9_CAPCC|nr:membrane protein insertase YidC [Capnocytophaga canimorsus]AEK23054.1 Inner membrane protein oxaA [Capnocytophaga canimorsus Cc5]CEN50833.1 Membrane protein insertase YidC [Capnocytophaga canimorsus]VEJ18177.1 Oxa1Ec [Capnocytophaga canimorsus]
MEEKKLDFKTILGFGLIFVLLIWVMYNNRPTEEELAKQKAEKEQIASEKQQATSALQNERNTLTLPTDSLSRANYAASLGAFAYSATLPIAEQGQTILENEDVKILVSNKGGQITEVLLKNYKTYDNQPVYLVKEDNALFSLQFTTSTNHSLQTENMFFEPSLTQEQGKKVLSMKLKSSENQYLEYIYELKDTGFLIDFSVRSQGLANVINTTKPIALDWQMTTRRMDKSVTYENRYTQLTALYQDDKVERMSEGSDDDAQEKEIRWVAFKQHLFSSMLISEKPFASGAFTSKNLVKDEGTEVKFTKNYKASLPIEAVGGELSESLHFYFGPSDYNLLRKYDKELGGKFDLAELIPLGWGIFGWLNKWLFIPLFSFLSNYFSIGVCIILMTVIVRIVLSPIVYKSYVSQAKMKVLRPEINEINEKYKEPMKRQQETMNLYRKAGVNPLSGCIPALLQLPVFLALFNFFPTEFGLRQKSFLWADDLSSYDAILQLPFSIPFYGNHVSLFPILASIAILIYSMMTMSQSMQQQQPGMPNMKFLIYLSPVMMLFFFNNYASGLSLYYFVSNLLTIFIMLAIKYWIIDEDKIHARIQENKKKPKKESNFQRRMREMMEQAEAQQKARQNMKK